MLLQHSRIVLTDNGVALTKNASTRWDTMQHPFNRVCDEHGIERKLAKPDHPGRTEEWFDGDQRPG